MQNDKNKQKKQSKNFKLVTKFNAKYNFVIVLVNKDGSLGYLSVSAKYENIHKQLLFWETNYSDRHEVEKFVIDELVYINN